MKIIRSIKHYHTFLFSLDLVVWSLSFIIAYWLNHLKTFPRIPDPYLAAIPVVLAVWAFSHFYFSLYEKKNGMVEEFIRQCKASALGLMILLSLSFFIRWHEYSRISIFLFVLIALILGFITRWAYFKSTKYLLQNIRWRKRLLILGCGEIGQTIIDELQKYPTEYQVLGFLDDDPQYTNGSFKEAPWLGPVSSLSDVVKENSVDEVIIAFPSADRDLQWRIIKQCNELEIPYRFVPDLFRLMLQDINVDILGEVPLVGMKGNRITGFNYLFKRTMDVSASFFLLILLAPLMLFVAVMIKLVSPGPVFFKQERIGYRRQPFTFYKFRSMHINSDEDVHKRYIKKWINNECYKKTGADQQTVYKITNDPRIIPWIGAFIRKFSIDELPQLFNVIKGDMSLVGPRPCLSYELQCYKSWHKARFDALPGITGLWQVSGRNRLSFDQMVRLDIRYLQNWSLEMDIAVMLKTPFVIVFDKAF